MAKRSKTSTSSQADSRVRTSQSPEKEQALKERGLVFGQKCTGLLAIYDPDTSSLKTSQCSLFGEEQELLATLPKQGMMRNGRLLGQTTLVRGTGEKGFGSWPTPTVDCVEGGEQSDRVERTKSGGYILRKLNKPEMTYGAKLSDAVLFEEKQSLTLKPSHSIPTPLSQDHIERKSSSTEKLNYETNKSVILDRWVQEFPDQETMEKKQEMFRTPNTMDGMEFKSQKALDHEYTHRQGRAEPNNLRDQIAVKEGMRTWPTPRGSNPGSRPNQKGGKVLAEEVEIAEGIRERGKKKHEKFPTPTASEKSGINPKTGRGSGLSKHAKMFPTPTTQEVEHPEANLTDTGRRKTKDGKNSHSLNLADTVKMFPTPSANEDAAGTPQGKMQRMLGNCEEVRHTGTGTLNPTWVEWLMGFPLEWTA